MKLTSSLSLGQIVSYFFLFSPVVFYGCGPIYNTEYKLTPPRGARGEQCIERCEDDASDCRSYQNSQKENCEYENQRLIDDCNYRIQRDKGRPPKWTECGRQLACDFSEATCETEFHNCYRYCGGEVKEIRTCVANCEEEKR